MFFQCKIFVYGSLNSLKQILNKVSCHLCRVIGVGASRAGDCGLSHVPGASLSFSDTLSSQTKNVKGPCEMLLGKVDFVFQRL